MDQNYNLNSNTNGIEIINGNKEKEIAIDIPDYTVNIEPISIDLSKYKNNKPTREIIRGKLLNE